MTPLTLTAWAEDVLREFEEVQLETEQTEVNTSRLRCLLAKLPELVERVKRLEAVAVAAEDISRVEFWDGSYPDELCAALDALKAGEEKG